MQRVATLLLSLCLFLLPSDCVAGGVAVLFAPDSPDVGPFPTDFLTQLDLLQKTGLRVNLPLPDCGAQPSACLERDLINELDGFSLLPRLRVRFSAPVNRHTLRQGIFVIWLDNLAPGEPGARPEGYTSGVNQVVWDPATNTAYAESDEVLDQHRRYALVVTDAVLDLASDPVGPDPAFTACVTPPFPSQYCERLATALDTLNVEGRIVAASVFTTLSATDWLEDARVAIQGGPINFQRPTPKSVFKISGLLGITVRSQVSTNPPGFEDFSVPFPSLLLPDVDSVAFGLYASPRFTSGDHTIPHSRTAVPLAPPVNTTEVYFHALLPKTAKPSGGYPVVIFGHGLGDSRFGASTLVSNGLAKGGLATIAINAVGHGSGPESVILLTELSGTTTLTGGGRGVDLNGDGAIGSREGCLILSPLPIGLRDCLRQTSVDLMQLVRAIRAGMDLDGDGSTDLDPNRIYYAGQSLGGLYGTVFTAAEPYVRAAALNVGGGSVVDIARWSQEFRYLVRDYLDARTPPLLNAGDDFDDDYVLRDQPVKVTRVPGAIEVQNVLEAAEWRQMPGDPASYAPHLRLFPLAGSTPKPVLWQFARGDRTVPNPQSSALIRGADMRESSRLYRHDLARAAAPSLPENPHAFLVDILSGPQAIAIAQAAQQQMAGFFFADGMIIPDVNGPLRPFFGGANLFETPARLPEDLGFSTGPVSVSAASYDATALAPLSIASAFGEKLASATAQATALPLPTILAGTTVRVIDSLGVERTAPLFFVSPWQVNYLLPAGTALGQARVIVTGSDGVPRSGTAVVERLAPGLFSANSSGQGVAAAVAFRRTGSGAESTQLVFQCPGGAGTCVPDPIDLGPEGDEVYLLLYGTGIRGRSSLGAVSVKIGGVAVPVSYAGDQMQYVGLDQINAGPLPRSLTGRGKVQILLVVDGEPANLVTAAIQ